jgi:hypothetical protein
MECREAQEHLAELSRGGLPVGMADAVRAHLDGCDGCREALRIEQQLHALVRAQALVRRAESQTPFPLGPVFPGDADAPLMSVTASELGGRPAVALVYRNAPGRSTTLLLMPGADATIPAEDRLAIETYTPHHRVVSGKQVLYWKQRDLAYVLVSDLDQSGLASMFLKVRKAA